MAGFANWVLSQTHSVLLAATRLYCLNRLGFVDTADPASKTAQSFHAAKGLGLPVI